MAEFAVAELTTLSCSFDEDVDLVRRLGVRGLGLFEPKLPEGRDAESARRLREAGITATVCMPGTLAILPMEKFPGPADPGERVEQICAQIRRLAGFEPVTTMCLTGPRGVYEPDEARRIVVEGLREIARTVREAGVPIGVEPIRESARDDFTIVATIPEAVELLEGSASRTSASSSTPGTTGTHRTCSSTSAATPVASCRRSTSTTGKRTPTAGAIERSRGHRPGRPPRSARSRRLGRLVRGGDLSRTTARSRSTTSTRSGGTSRRRS